MSPSADRHPRAAGAPGGDRGVAAAQSFAAAQSLATALRFALRELRGGLGGFRIFILCIALGVAAIAGVNSVRRAMTETIAEEGQSILGGDLAFALVNREASPAEAASIGRLGTVSVAATLRAMARKGDGVDQTLVEIKAVDAAYPLYGRLEAETAGGVIADDARGLLARDGRGRYGALVEVPLMVRLGLAIGDEISVGTAQFTVAGVVRSEPDKVAGGVGFGPRLLIGEAALRETGLLQPGSLVRWHYRVKLASQVADEAGLRALANGIETAHPDAAFETRSRANAAPSLKRNIDRFAQFLTLVGLTALIVGGVGVANAVRAYLDGKRDVIATLKCLGASGSFVFRVYFLQILAIAGLGIVAGLVLGSIAPPIAGYFLSGVLPIGARAVLYPAELGLAVAYGFLVAVAFASIPLGRAHDVPPTALFRDAVEPDRRLPRPRYLVLVGAALAGLAALALGLAEDRVAALLYLAALGAAFGLLRLVAIGVIALAARMPSPPSAELRLALRNIHRPGAPTGSVVLSLGLGMTLLVTLALVDANLRDQIRQQLPKHAPSFFFMDVPNRQVPEFNALVRREAPDAQLVDVPMLRGRIVALKGVPAASVTPAREAAWVLTGDRGITYSDSLPENSRMVSGSWWAKDYAGPPLVSFEEDIARGLGLAIGDSVRVNVLGREFEAKIANFRRLQWETLGINFVMVFSPNTFRGAPHSFLATVTWADGGTADKEVDLLRKVTAAFPVVTTIRVKDALQAVDDLVGKLADGVGAAAGVTLATAVLVLAGALAAGQRRRIYDAVVLKTLGATRRRILTAFAFEYGLVGLAAALFGLVAGSAAAWMVLSRIMGLTFALDAAVAIGSVALALAATLGFGLYDTWRALGAKAAPVLRHL
ncbi:ABC transporter permease [Prosthecodimorpha staleyi]|uniref:ABC transporter permease n=1 Tax=Prosthecodimorpha staleyi TaxID=2840188 RepID=A0A947D6I8_9HYPH|nr:ABC transporter permease [Prosthecodimorpha staleyi]MBT9291054.1 ABC transporter permease [Prosthecodimorpha staleyi]